MLSQSRPAQRWIAAGLPALLAGALAACAPKPDVAAQLAAGAVFAQERCYRLVHHDTFAFQSCIDALLRDEPGATARRLGIEYFGWAGALNSARVGMRGAAPAAYAFLQQFRATQRRLKVDDIVLCRSIPGECDARVARMRQMESSPPPEDAGTDDGDDGHVH